MKILHYQHSSGLGGVTDLTLDLIKYSSEDFQHIFVCHQDDERTAEEFKQLGVKYIANIRFSDSIVERIIKQERPDIVHCQPGAYAECCGANAAIRLNIPVVATIGTDGRANDKYNEHPLVTIVAGSKELFKKQIEKARFIYHGIDLERLNNTDKRRARKHWGLDHQQVVVGWVGRYIAFKGPGTFIGIAKHVRDVDERIQFIMFGDKDGFESACELSDTVGAGVLFAQGTRAKVLAYNCLDIGCFITWGEAFGRVGAEMLAAGVPMITTLRPTNLEIAGEHAIYLPPPNHWQDKWDADNYVKMWAYTILSLLEEEDMREGMSKGGQERARRLFDARRMAKEYNELYREIT